MNQDENPFASPAVDVAPLTVATEEERIRRKFIAAETSLQSIGFLYYLVAGGTIAGLGMTIVDNLQWPGGWSASGLGIMALFALLVPVLIVLGRGIRVFNPRLRIPAAAFAGLVCLAIVALIWTSPGAGLTAGLIPLLIGLYAVYLLLGSKGRMVFSPEYAEIRYQTPHVKCRTSPIVMGCFVILLALLVLAIIGPALILVTRLFGRG